MNTFLKRRGIAGLTCAGLVAADLLLKSYAQEMLRGRSAVVVIPGFWELTYAENRDIGFSLLSFIPTDIRPYVIVPLVTMGLGAVLLYGYRHAHSTRILAASTLIASGAVGNLLDRLDKGYVIDYIHWYVGSFHWPIFNLADVNIVLGAALILWDEFARSHAARSRAARESRDGIRKDEALQEENASR